ncbi:hypothetical protein QBC38DRAFT_537060 [Podospora fimiseda]|uniref:C2H2-type domain-containing protein n=1 Tax=Podospora fimiseda TaxID=252190 RepID=A0AAN7GXR6_9PEZI|nr:hypothetical protein QBC38DRAFT_537060 [Podospora fimiseda]
MEPGVIRGRSPRPVSSRVAQKLASSDTVICIPYRPRIDAAYARKGAAADLDVATQISVSVSSAAAAVDALSLSGTTPPTSPTMVSFAGGHKALIDSHKKVHDESNSPVDVPTKDPVRRHNRGIGSIDSILSTTTCVNTHSECSRAESRLSREIRIEIEDTDGGVSLISRHANPNMSLIPGNPLSTMGLSSGSRPGSSMTCKDLDDQEGLDDEARHIDEISSWVLRNTWGKDVDDCAAPLLVWDCTYRYVQELWTAATDGTLGIVHATSGQGSPTSQGGGSPGDAGNDQQASGYFTKGKRKAEGGSEDGSGMGGQDNNQGDEDGNTPMGSQGYASRNSGISNFSCPYRKRNPLRFNVREHYVCATHSFSDMSQLKKHIRAHHPPVQRNAGPFLCPRCCQGFPSKNDLDSHLRQLTVCRLSDDHGGADPEDGITQKIISSLEARSLKAKIDNWVSLWKLLFPHDSVIPDPCFIPVMEIFDFISESKKFVATLKDLLELQYRHVLEGTREALGIDVKIRQGLERSTQSIYNWIETVVQDWEQRISGTVSFFTGADIDRASAPESWPAGPQLLPPSPASTPTVVSGTTSSGIASIAAGTDTENSGSALSAGARNTPAARRRPNPPPKRIKRAEVLPKAQQPTTQIPQPIQRARTPQSQVRAMSSSFRPRPVLPSQSIQIPTSVSPHLEPTPSFPHPTWEPTVTMPSNYNIPYTNAGDMFQPAISAPAQYSPIPITQGHLEGQNYLKHEHQPSPDAVHIPTSEGMQHDLGGRPQSTMSTSTISTMRASRLMTPRSSIASTWMRDENRDSSQTLVEAHPPGRCQNMYCPSCSKAMPDDVGVTHMTVQSPVGMHHPAPPGQHHQHTHAHQHGLYVTGAGSAFPATTGPHEVHNFEPVDWGYHSAGGGGNANMFGGHGGPQETF